MSQFIYASLVFLSGMTVGYQIRPVPVCAGPSHPTLLRAWELRQETLALAQEARVYMTCQRGYYRGDRRVVQECEAFMFQEAQLKEDM